MEQKLMCQFSEEGLNRWLAARRPAETVRLLNLTTGRLTASDRGAIFKDVESAEFPLRWRTGRKA